MAEKTVETQEVEKKEPKFQTEKVNAAKSVKPKEHWIPVHNENWVKNEKGELKEYKRKTKDGKEYTLNAFKIPKLGQTDLKLYVYAKQKALSPFNGKDLEDHGKSPDDYKTVTLTELTGNNGKLNENIRGFQMTKDGPVPFKTTAREIANAMPNRWDKDGNPLLRKPPTITLIRANEKKVEQEAVVEKPVAQEIEVEKPKAKSNKKAKSAER